MLNHNSCARFRHVLSAQEAFVFVALIRDYLQLCKPVIVLLMVLTALASMIVATADSPPVSVMLGGLLGIALCAAASAVLNHTLERHTDSRMARTQHRPLPANRVSVRSASIWAGVLAAGGTVLLLRFTNPLCTVLTLAALLGYAAVYTLWLKPATPYNIVIGGLPGASPPLLGWTAVTGDIAPAALVLVAIIFAWTPAHFWALALHRLEDYRRVGIPMLPVTHGEAYTRLQILLYTLLTLAMSLLFFAGQGAGLLYLGTALVLGLSFVFHAAWLMYRPGGQCAMSLFHLSNLYLLLLFAGMVVDHLLLPPASLPFIL